MNPAVPQSRSALSVLATFTLTAVLGGCGGAGAPPPEWGEDTHADLTLASDRDGGGSLVIAYNFGKPVEVTFVQCFGGEPPDCQGGLRLYAAEDPGFVSLGARVPGEDLFALPDDVEVSLELLAADSGASLAIEGATLDEAGDTAVLGATPDLHAHGSWQLAIPGGEEPAESYALTLRAVTQDGFGPSPAYVVLMHPEPP
jgi:hypothetical protein